jgi:hypothetical protein
MTRHAQRHPFKFSAAHDTLPHESDTDNGAEPSPFMHFSTWW